MPDELIHTLRTRLQSLDRAMEEFESKVSEMNNQQRNQGYASPSDVADWLMDYHIIRADFAEYMLDLTKARPYFCDASDSAPEIAFSLRLFVEYTDETTSHLKQKLDSYRPAVDSFRDDQRDLLKQMETHIPISTSGE
ncbi:hypothetical protein ACFL0V_02265 [Nanoarchaeota archaeon]